MRRNGERSARRGCVAVVLGAALWAGAAPLHGQARSLSLEEALRIAEERSEQVAIASAGVMRAEGQRLQARSEFFPQIFGSLGYTRTLASEFEALRGDDTGQETPSPDPAPEDCGDFIANPALPLQARVDSLEAYVRCTSTANPFAAFSDLPFGRENQWTLGLTASQTVFAGGRLWAQNRAASASVRTAEIALSAARAEVVLDIARAYYDAALADRLLEIAQSTLAQAETTLEQVRVGLQVGEQPEFELLRAQVTRDTQEPVVIQRRATRDIARLRLRQLLDLPLDDEALDLTSSLEDVESDAALRVATALLDVLPDTAVDARAPVLQAQQAVVAQEAQVSVARAQRWPSLSLSTNYARVNYPEDLLPQAWNRFRTNWTVSASVSVPIFTGGRISGEVMAAEASAEEARARLTLTRELTALDTRSALEQLEAARATWQASTGTVSQADQAFEIAQIRFREGLSTQLELTDSRILLQQAQANRAQAARDLLVARLRAALLPLLPLDTGAAGGTVQQQQQPVQQGAGVRTQQVSRQGTGVPVGTTGTGGR